MTNNVLPVDAAGRRYKTATSCIETKTRTATEVKISDDDIRGDDYFIASSCKPCTATQSNVIQLQRSSMHPHPTDF